MVYRRDPELERTVGDMLEELERDGMEAVRRFSRRFDEWDPPDLELSPAQIDEAIQRLPAEVVRDTDTCQANVRAFAEAQMATMLPLEVETQPGVVLGHRHIPVGSVGCYIPGGRYPLFGSAQMSIIPARVAGVRTVLACTPPIKGTGPFPATVNAIRKAGADRLFVVGGVQAFALLAFGMGVVEPVDMLCGAGNRFVAEAKRQLFGRCGIDLLAGPTEILVIADDAADPGLVACDLLGQAEHDPASGVCLITLSEAFAGRVVAELERQLADLPTKDVAAASWGANGTVLVAASAQEAVKLSDDWAPEHLELHVRDASSYQEALTNYGSLFVGEETTVAYGDKCIGTNHILPTGRAARYTGGLWVGKFLKTCTYQRMTPQASVDIAEVTERQCLVENMIAHAATARARLERYSGS